MFKINPISFTNPQFQAKSLNNKLATQKLEKALNDTKLPKSLRDSLSETQKTKNPLIDSVQNITSPKAQVIDDVGIFMAKRAPQEYAVTSAKLAEQKGQKLSLLL